MRPLCIVVNGPSAVGKSTLTRSLQDLSARPLIKFGVDEFYRMVPSKWLAGTVGNTNLRGFQYAEYGYTEDGFRLRNLDAGEDSIRMLLQMNAAVGAMLQEGGSVIVDGQSFEPEVPTDLRRRLSSLSSDGTIELFYVELQASRDVIKLRNARHDHPSYIGIYQTTLPPQDQTVDLLIDTSSLEPVEVLNRVLEHLAASGVSIA